VLVGGLRSTVADDDIAIDQCLPSEVMQTSHFKGRQDRF